MSSSRAKGPMYEQRDTHDRREGVAGATALGACKLEALFLM